MRVFIDLEFDRLTAGLGVAAALAQLSFKRAPALSLEVQFTRDGTVQELAPGATGVFGIKATGKYDDGYIAASLAWVKTGTGTSTVYTFNFTLITTPLDALFVVDGNPANDVAEITAMAEIQWVISGTIYKTQTVKVVLANDVNRGDEALPPNPPIIYGSVLDFLATMTVPAYSIVTSRGEVADSTDIFDYDRVIGISPLAVGNGFIGQAVADGEVTNPSWSWSPNDKLFLNGTSISTTPPASGFCQLLGVARTATTVIFRLGVPVKL